MLLITVGLEVRISVSSQARSSLPLWNPKGAERLQSSLGTHSLGGCQALHQVWPGQLEPAIIT